VPPQSFLFFDHDIVSLSSRAFSFSQILDSLAFRPRELGSRSVPRTSLCHSPLCPLLESPPQSREACAIEVSLVPAFEGLPSRWIDGLSLFSSFFFAQFCAGFSSPSFVQSASTPSGRAF